jgi:hypothetical protein
MDPKPYSWQSAYLSAILEINPDKMLDRIEAAYAAIEARLRYPVVEDAEQTAIDSARKGLAALKSERLKGPTFRIDL